MTKITGMHKKGATENMEELGMNPTIANAIAANAPKITTTATTMSPTSGGRPAAAGNHPAGGIGRGGTAGDGAPDPEGPSGGSTLPD